MNRGPVSEWGYWLFWGFKCTHTHTNQTRCFSRHLLFFWIWYRKTISPPIFKIKLKIGSENIIFQKSNYCDWGCSHYVIQLGKLNNSDPTLCFIALFACDHELDLWMHVTCYKHIHSLMHQLANYKSITEFPVIARINHPFAWQKYFACYISGKISCGEFKEYCNQTEMDTSFWCAPVPYINDDVLMPFHSIQDNYCLAH